jgi:hypothetical protein
MVATPQKSLLDFFYINSFYNTEREIHDLRLNEAELGKIIVPELYQYLERYQSKALDNRIRKLTRLYSL